MVKHSNTYSTHMYTLIIFFDKTQIQDLHIQSCKKKGYFKNNLLVLKMNGINVFEITVLDKEFSYRLNNLH